MSEWYQIGRKIRKEKVRVRKFFRKGGNQLQVLKILVFCVYLEKSFICFFFFIFRNFLEVMYIVINFKGYDEFEDKFL